MVKSYSEIMQTARRCSCFILILISIASLLSLVVAKDDKVHHEDGLEIHYTFKPEVCNRKAQALDLLTIHYKGTLKDGGKTFDSSHDRGQPLKVQIGIGQVILGWEKGLLGVCAGEKRKLVIPPHMAYGDSDQHDDIPPRSTLIFEIEVISVEDGPKPNNVFKDIDTDNDNRLSRKEIGEFLKKQIERNQAHGDMGDMDDPDQNQMIEEIFSHEDKDKDGFITFEEFSGPKYDHDEL